MRNLTMADGCLDAPRHGMKRLEFWLVFIDAEHMASDLLASDLHNAFASYQVFPILEIRWPHSHEFHSRRLVGPCRNRNFAIQGCFPLLVQPDNRLPEGSLRF